MARERTSRPGHVDRLPAPPAGFVFALPRRSLIGPRHSLWRFGALAPATHRPHSSSIGSAWVAFARTWSLANALGHRWDWKEGGPPGAEDGEMKLLLVYCTQQQQLMHMQDANISAWSSAAVRCGVGSSIWGLQVQTYLDGHSDFEYSSCHHETVSTPITLWKFRPARAWLYEEVHRDREREREREMKHRRSLSSLSPLPGLGLELQGSPDIHNCKRCGLLTHYKIGFRMGFDPPLPVSPTMTRARMLWVVGEPHLAMRSTRPPCAKRTFPDQTARTQNRQINSDPSCHSKWSCVPLDRSQRPSPTRDPGSEARGSAEVERSLLQPDG